ncbi:MAG: UPF0175 family protein [Kovacikia sp.]
MTVLISPNCFGLTNHCQTKERSLETVMLKLVKGSSQEGPFMHTVTLTIPEEALQALQTTPDKLSQEMLMVIAVKLYELGRLSSGAAASLAGIPRTDFLSKLGDYGVDTFRLSEVELTGDLANA